MAKDPLELDPLNQLDPKRGRLLVSGPYLPDPYFRRTVVLLCDHDGEGSFGFVLNRYIDLQISDLVEGFPAIKTRVAIGGPVQSGNLYYLHTFGARLAGSQEVVAGVSVGGDFEQLQGMLTADPRLARHVRFFVGYSGWGKDQLSNEMQQRSWLVGESTKARIMGTKRDDLWAETLRSMGGEYATLAGFPEDPTLN